MDLTLILKDYFSYIKFFLSFNMTGHVQNLSKFVHSISALVLNITGFFQNITGFDLNMTGLTPINDWIYFNND